MYKTPSPNAENVEKLILDSDPDQSHFFIFWPPVGKLLGQI